MFQHFRSNCAKNSALFPKNVYVWIPGYIRQTFQFRKNVNTTLLQIVHDQRLVFLCSCLVSVIINNEFLFVHFEFYLQYLKKIIEDLTPDDIRHLIQYEDELTQLGSLVKLNFLLYNFRF